MALQIDNDIFKRRLQCLASHLGAQNYERVISSVNPLECSTSPKFLSRRRDSMLLFSRQGSETYSQFMRQESVKQVTTIEETRNASQSPCELSEKDVQSGTPLFGKSAAENNEEVKSNSAENLPKDVQKRNFSAEEVPLFARASLSTEEKPAYSFPSEHQKLLKEPERKSFKWIPRMDVLESGGEYVLLVELPGVNVEGIKVEVDRERLTITGTRPIELWRFSGSELAPTTTAECALYHQQDLNYGPYRTVWRLPGHVDMDRISAEFINGVLMVLVPKFKSNATY